MVKVPPENSCAWCSNFIDEDAEIYAVGAKFPQNVDMKKHVGTVIFLGFEGTDKKVPALLPVLDSPAKEQGVDLMFMTCSQGCFSKLKETLEKEADLLDVKKM